MKPFRLPSRGNVVGVREIESARFKEDREEDGREKVGRRISRFICDSFVVGYKS